MAPEWTTMCWKVLEQCQSTTASMAPILASKAVCLTWTPAQFLVDPIKVFINRMVYFTHTSMNKFDMYFLY